ncbi:MAG TPA: helix-turn-helix domain-containing protein, partial [Burkholderiales bacterium]|nr:helix-turn-helix domain-containing protein [Burkholderiales bacterium]
MFRAVGILRELAAHNAKGLRLYEIAELMQLERPTAHRMLRGLLSQGMLAQDPAGKAYRLGPLVYELGLAASPDYTLREKCQPALKRL